MDLLFDPPPPDYPELTFQIVGAPGDREGQLAVLRRALRLLAEATEPGTFEEMPRP